MRTSAAAKAVIGAALATALAAGCSSSGSGGAGGNTSAPATSAAASSGSASPATGTPVKIMVMAVKNNPVLSQQEQFDGATASVNTINAAGGVNGHKLVLVQCDTKLDPNAEQACLNKAVTEKVAAIVGSTILFSTFANLETAKIPLLAVQGITPAQLQSKISYPLGAFIAWFGGQAQMAKDAGAKTVAISYTQTDSGKFSSVLMADQATKAGLKVVTQVGTALTTTDWTADAATLTKDNPDWVMMAGSTGTAPGLIRAIKAGGYQGKISVNSSALKEEDLQKFKDSMEGVEVAGATLPATSDDPSVKAYLAGLEKYSPGAKVDENGMLGWSGVLVFAEVMKDATSFTGADVIAAADKVTTPIQAGPWGPWVGAGTSPIATYPRMFNHSFVPGTVKNGEVVATGDFQNAAVGD
jgi:ABC-type branched-subunit amino acid transport system substrate-binding protein